MQELEKILEEIEQKKEKCLNVVKMEIDPMEITIHREQYKGLCMAEKSIRKHMNNGWIPVEERMPTKKECENNYFWIMLKYNASPVIAKCAWIESEDEKGNDDNFSEFFIDQYPQMYTPSKNIVIAWKIAYVPEPYHPERSERE